MTGSTQKTQNYKQKEIWTRGLYMLLFLLVHGLVKGIVLFIAVIQFLVTLFRDGPNTQLKAFGQGLSTYLYDTNQFLMYNTEQKPFPFSEWRNDPPATATSLSESVHD